MTAVGSFQDEGRAPARISASWEVAPDLPAGTMAARDLLLKDPVRLTEADRDSLHRFFRERIERAKAASTAASWEQQLEQVFDYTAWHQFVVKIDRSNGAGWQLAAVAAHYQPVPEAPRIILLDEVFVGVDSNNRGQVFALPRAPSKASSRTDVARCM